MVNIVEVVTAMVAAVDTAEIVFDDVVGVAATADDGKDDNGFIVAVVCIKVGFFGDGALVVIADVADTAIVAAEDAAVVIVEGANVVVTGENA